MVHWNLHTGSFCVLESGLKVASPRVVSAEACNYVSLLAIPNFFIEFVSEKFSQTQNTRACI